MRDLSMLYREVVLDHSASPRNYGRLDGATHSADGDNPLCGDSIHVELAVDGDTVTDARFDGVGCAIATASASLMTEAVRGKTAAQARALSDEMQETCSGQRAGGSAVGDVEMGTLAVFEGVRRYPLRAKCATLAWRTMRSALDAQRS